jgi:hypothetical protein
MLFCSVITQSFLPHARVLAESLAEHHPNCLLEILVVDESDHPAPPDEPFRRISFDEIALTRQEINRRLTLYVAAELLSSLRGPLMEGCLARTDGPVIYLDVDMIVLGPLTDLCELTARNDILLSPHSTVPLPYVPGGNGPEQNFMQCGVFNGALLGVSQSAMDFLRWRDERVARDCIMAFDRGLYFGQCWLSLVPALFKHYVLRDRGINLSAHAMGDDDIEWRSGRAFIGSTPVRLFHFFGGFDPHAGGIDGSRDLPPWIRDASKRTGIKRLSQEYGNRLLRTGFDERFPQREELDRVMRGAYRTALLHSEANNTIEPPNPFTNGMQAFTA